MQTRRKIALQLVAAVFAMVIATGLATAQRLEFQGPEARMEEWRQGFLRFVEKHPDLTNDQILAIQKLADIDDRGAFVTTLQPKRRQFLVEGLQELSRVLPYADYLKLLRSFGDLRLWLVANDLATQFETALPNCDCTTNSNCQSGTCNQATSCEPKATTHSGVCAGAVE